MARSIGTAQVALTNRHLGCCASGHEYDRSRALFAGAGAVRFPVRLAERGSDTQSGSVLETWSLCRSLKQTISQSKQSRMDRDAPEKRVRHEALSAKNHRVKRVTLQYRIHSRGHAARLLQIVRFCAIRVWPSNSSCSVHCVGFVAMGLLRWLRCAVYCAVSARGGSCSPATVTAASSNCSSAKAL